MRPLNHPPLLAAEERRAMRLLERGARSGGLRSAVLICGRGWVHTGFGPGERCGARRKEMRGLQTVPGQKEENIVDAGGMSERENESDSWEVMSGDREREGDVENNIKGWERYKKESEKETDRDRDAFDAA